MAKEYISREAAIDAMTADNLLKHFDSVEDVIEKRFHRAAERILVKIPAADVVEVVRCQECKHAEPYGLYGLDLKCNKHSGSPKTKFREEICYIELHTPHFFCSDGKRKDGGQDDV